VFRISQRSELHSKPAYRMLRSEGCCLQSLGQAIFSKERTYDVIMLRIKAGKT
jgi:hypothetical protein